MRQETAQASAADQANAAGACRWAASWPRSGTAHHLLTPRALQLGLVSLLFRQTNVVWLAFILGTTLVSLPGVASAPRTPMTTALRRLPQLANWRAAGIALPYTPVFVLFAAFVAHNGGIVLGDKAHHAMSLHFAQLPYLAAFSLFFGWPALVGQAGGPVALAWRTYRSSCGSVRALVGSALLLAATAAAVHWGSVAHPFLLADNRHYAFYLWRRVLSPHRYALVPLYALSARMWWDALGECAAGSQLSSPLTSAAATTQSPLWLLGFVLSSALTLVPSPLLEPRYFLLPYVLMRLHLLPDRSAAAEAPPAQASSAKPSTGKPASGQDATSAPPAPAAPALGPATPPPWARAALFAEGALHLALGGATLFVFLRRPFEWPSEPGAAQRFMW